VTWKPTETELAERLTVDTVDGEAWRCLRCATFVVGPPAGTGPAEDAPVVLRGKALRDAFILRLLAAERFIRGLLLVALAYGIYQFNGAQDSLEQVFQEYLPKATLKSGHGSSTSRVGDWITAVKVSRSPGCRWPVIVPVAETRSNRVTTLPCSR